MAGHLPSLMHTLLENQDSRVAAAEQLLLDRDAVIRLLKENLCQSQTRMNQQADRHRSERAFEVGDMVYWPLQPFQQTFVSA